MTGAIIIIIVIIAADTTHGLKAPSWKQIFIASTHPLTSYSIALAKHSISHSVSLNEFTH